MIGQSLPRRTQRTRSLRGTKHQSLRYVLSSPVANHINTTRSESRELFVFFVVNKDLCTQVISESLPPRTQRTRSLRGPKHQSLRCVLSEIAAKHINTKKREPGKLFVLLVFFVVNKQAVQTSDRPILTTKNTKDTKSAWHKASKLAIRSLFTCRKSHKHYEK